MSQRRTKRPSTKKLLEIEPLRDKEFDPRITLSSSVDRIKQPITLKETNFRNCPSRLSLERERKPGIQATPDAASNRSCSRSVSISKRYEIKPIIPAKKNELIPVAKAMHRNEFGTNLRTLFNPEKEAALEAIESGVYIGWRCDGYAWDCIRIGRSSRCFCDHSLAQHETYTGNSIKIKCLSINCSCECFRFIPGKPEDIGEWWLQKRPGFDLSTWRAKCKCKHTHVRHDPQTKRCASRGCSCFNFQSDFLCAACDRHWEDHWTFFDTAVSRKHKGLPTGEEYLPFHEMSELRDVLLSNEKQSVNAHRGRIHNAISGSKAQFSSQQFR